MSAFCQFTVDEEDVIGCDWVVNYQPHVAEIFRTTSPTWLLFWYSASWLCVSFLGSRVGLRYSM